jgi:cyclopropane-fatty-acyl-phospholipid synthase
MNKRLQVNHLADDIKKLKKSTFLGGIYKKGALKKFKNLNSGCIYLIDGNQDFTFGDINSSDKVTVTVFSQEFYVFLGSAGVLGASEAYTAGYWKADNLVLLTQIILKNKSIMKSIDSGLGKILLNLINGYIHSNRENTLNGSKKNILAHYDLSNEFYKLWLDSTMTYSAAFFKEKSASLEDASIEKLDRLCRKLDLKESDNVLEIGTGWGSFAIHAAKKYGCHVTTTTISDAQFEYASNRINEENLQSKITILNKDYRDLEGKYDKLISIEMIEAVGYEFIPDFFKTSSSLLNPNGLMALQGITYNDQGFDTYKNSVDLIKKYIFPGSCLISIDHITDVIKKKTDLSIVDFEDITTHYVETLKRWRTNFLNSIDQVKELGFSDAFINMWEFYLVYCEAGFAERHIGDVQIVFAKSEARDIKIDY